MPARHQTQSHSHAHFGRLCFGAVIAGLALILGLGAAIARRPAALAQGDTRVRCQPIAVTSVSSTLDVDLYVENVTDLYGADVRLSFDPGVAQGVDADASLPGVQIEPLDGFLWPDFVARNEADNVSGTVWYALTQLNPRPPASGSGSLARIKFERVLYGTSTLSLTSQLARQDGSPMPALTQDCTISFGRPLPLITSLNPTGAIAGGLPFTLTVNGADFVSGSMVYWNGALRATTLISSTQLVVAIPAADIATAGAASVTVINPAPGGGTSNAQTFSIITTVQFSTDTSSVWESAGTATLTVTLGAPSALTVTVGYATGDGTATAGPLGDYTAVSGTLTFGPGEAAHPFAVPITNDRLVEPNKTVLLALSHPSQAALGAPYTATLIIVDDDVPAQISVQVAPSALVANSGMMAAITATLADVSGTRLSGGVLTGSISSSALGWVRGLGATNDSGEAYGIWMAGSVPGVGTLTVTDGNVTGTAAVTLNSPVPTLTSLSPATTTVGSLPFTLTVIGANFYSGSKVHWNGMTRMTTFISGTQLEAAILAGDVAAEGTLSVTVVNPTPGGGVSNALPFTVFRRPPAPDKFLIYLPSLSNGYTAGHFWYLPIVIK